MSQTRGSQRYAHLTDETFTHHCRQIAVLAEVAMRPSSIDTYSREKLNRVQELAADALLRIDRVTK